MAADEGRLSRWSRRKTATRRGGAAPVIQDAPSGVPAAGEAVSPAEDTAPLSVDGAAPAPAAPDDETASPPSDDAALPDLPDIESLHADSDFTAFMKEGVPAHLRTLALRKLWVSDPALANLDGLIDYGEDFTDIKSGVFEAVKTVLESGDEGEHPAESVESQPAEPDSKHADGDFDDDTGAGDIAGEDPVVMAENPENPQNSAELAEKPES